jgi:hypothetical protein
MRRCMRICSLRMHATNHGNKTCQQVKPGMAHLCNEAFAAWHPWGSWRRRREFVGRLGYGTRYLLWNPEVECLRLQMM